MEAILGEWENRENKYPWVLTIGIILFFIVSILIGLFQELENNYIQTAYNFSFMNYLSLILWIPDAFLIGFLKNQNRTRDPQAGGSLIRSFIYGFSLFIGVFILFLGFSEIISVLDLGPILDTTPNMRYEIAWVSVLASAIGAFLSISLRGPVCEEFLPIEN